MDKRIVETKDIMRSGVIDVYIQVGKPGIAFSDMGFRGCRSAVVISINHDRVHI